MESRTKVSLSAPEIYSLVCNAFANVRDAPISEMKDGYFNTVYHIEITSDSEKFHTVLKVGPSDDTDILSYEAEILQTEVNVMRMLYADNFLPIPRVHYADFSREFLPNDYYFMEFIDGVAWNKVRRTLSEEQNHSIEFQLGEITSRVNSHSNPEFGFCSGHPKFRTWSEACQYMFRLLFDDAKRYRTELPITGEDFFSLFDSHSSNFCEVNLSQLVLWDLWPGNVFIKFERGNPYISGIIDFERSFWGDPLCEYFYRGFEQHKHFTKGYGQDLLTTPSQLARSLFYDIYMDLVLIIECGPRQYTNNNQDTWARKRLSSDLVKLYSFDTT